TRTTIESDAGFICAMKVNRIPIVALFPGPPGRRAVMMTTPEKVMQPKWRHVINHCFMLLKHDARDGLTRISISRESHSNPFIGNLLCREVGIPGQPAKCIPVGLEEMVAGPISICTGVGNARKAGDFLMIE